MQEEDKTGCFGKWIRVFKIIRTDKRGLWYWEVSYDFPVCNPVLDRRKMDRKVLFFDIDGTLLSESTREVPKSARDADDPASADVDDGGHSLRPVHRASGSLRLPGDLPHAAGAGGALLRPAQNAKGLILILVKMA